MVDRKIANIKEVIDEKIKLSKNNMMIVDSILCDEMNLDRCYGILKTILNYGLGEESVMAFLTYQLYKVCPEKAEEIMPKLTPEEQEMIETFKWK